jgi:predicted MPP superfamily phosphohydrolase
MRTGMFIIIFSIFILLYLLINYYIYNRAVQALPPGSYLIYFKVIYWVIVSSYVVGRVVERYHISFFTDALTWVGSFWLAAMLYFFMMVILIDLVRLSNYFIGYLPPSLYSYPGKTWVMLSATSIVFLIVAIGHINAINPRITRLTIELDKKANGLDELNIALASDIHMGTVIGPRRMTKLVNKITEIKPDIILLAGDIVDEDLQPVIRHNLGEVLKKLKAPMGVYGITGNHEYIGGVAEAVKYLEDHNIKFLRDSVLNVNNSFYIVGREDRSKNRRNSKRKDINTLLNGVDHSLPIIMLDHQPFELDYVVNSKVDIQFSGHTHHGQLWPLNYITEAMYEISRGYKKIGNTHFYVSNGFGTWGPPVRIGNSPEIVFLNLKFSK